VVRVCSAVLCYKEWRATAGAPEAVYIPAVPVSDHVAQLPFPFLLRAPVPPAAPVSLLCSSPMHLHQRTVVTDRFRLAFASLKHHVSGSWHIQ
jgi:hypothetical protein